MATPNHLTTPAEQWIKSSGFDLSFFSLSPLLGVALVLTTPLAPSVIPLAASTLLGFPHYFSTFAFYFWDDYRERHRVRWLAFLAGPVIVVAATALVFALHLVVAIALLTYFWNAWHVSRQSCGILSIYRQRAGIVDLDQRALANNAIISTNLCCAVWNTEWYPALHRGLSLPGAAFPRLLWLFFLMAAIVSIGRLGVGLWRRQAVGRGPRTAEFAFLISSLLLFHPYLWVRNSGLATSAMLLGHFVQYLAIVWLLHRRRFRVASGSSGQVSLYRLSSDLRILLPTLLASGILVAIVYKLMESFSLLGQFEMLVMMLAFTHFYLDGLFWTFRDPSVRNTIGPYVFANPQRPVSVAAVQAT